MWQACWFHAGAGFLPYIPAWGKLLPDIVPATLVASILFFTPVSMVLLLLHVEC